MAQNSGTNVLIRGVRNSIEVLVAYANGGYWVVPPEIRFSTSGATVIKFSCQNGNNLFVDMSSLAPRKVDEGTNPRILFLPWEVDPTSEEAPYEYAVSVQDDAGNWVKAEACSDPRARVDP